jgi:hypothetical protein
VGVGLVESEPKKQNSSVFLSSVSWRIMCLCEECAGLRCMIQGRGYESIKWEHAGNVTPQKIGKGETQLYI